MHADSCALWWAIAAQAMAERSLRGAAQTAKRQSTLALVLLVSFLPAAVGYVFNDRKELLGARDAWCADATTASATYGPIGGWDVRRVTDLSYLFCADPSGVSLGCNTACASFNDDISSWTLSRGLSYKMQVMLHLLLIQRYGICACTHARTRARPLRMCTSPALSDTHAHASQGTFWKASAFNRPLNWDTSTVSSLYVRRPHCLPLYLCVFVAQARAHKCCALWYHRWLSPMPVPSISPFVGTSGGSLVTRPCTAVSMA